MTIEPESLGESNEGDGDVNGADKDINPTSPKKKKKAPSLLKMIARIRYRTVVHVVVACVPL